MSIVSIISLCLLCLAVGFIAGLMIVKESSNDVKRHFDDKPKEDLDKKA